MKLMIASDIHGSAYYCKQLLEAFRAQQADRLLILGDILYHGPRNDLPRDYAPKEVISMLNEMKDKINDKDKEILVLKNEISSFKNEADLKNKNLKETYEEKLKEKDAQIEYFKDLKTKMSTKMVGETLERHCETEFNRLRATGFQRAYFEKDNDIKTGSKGDYLRSFLWQCTGR